MDFRRWFLSEVNWEGDPSQYGFSDTYSTCIPIEQFVDDLNEQLARYEEKKREKFYRNAEKTPDRMMLPQFSKNALKKFLDPQTGEFSSVTVLDFARLLNLEPKTIFDVGEKSKHTNQLEAEVFTVNTGIPALRAIIFDQQKQQFYSVNTCPGAGSCVISCYALKGFYVMNDGKNIKLHQRANLLVNNPMRYYERARDELKKIALEQIPKGKFLKLRWNDAGDWFSKTYYNIAVRITKELKSIKLPVPSYVPGETSRVIDFKDKILSYGYTKRSEFVKLGKKDGLVMNFSLGAKPEEVSNLELDKTKLSVVVPSDVTKGIFEKKKKNEPFKYKPGMHKEFLRKTIAAWAVDSGYMIPGEKLLFTDEIVRIPEGKAFWHGRKKYNVIVLPSDSDVSAYRRDVHYSFLMHH